MEEGKKQLKIEKYFTKGIEDVYKDISWNKSDVEIADGDGKTLFVQKNCEFPKYFSPLARKVIASKYFYGDQNSIERENSFRQLGGRVSETIADWGLKDGYFDKNGRDIFEQELGKLIFDQRAAFNSPVWFNVGTNRYPSKKTKDDREEYAFINGKIRRIPINKLQEYPQTSACFIQSVGDTMREILMLSVYEGMLFSYGSGTGTDLSTLRSSREKLSGGGKPSGPLAYELFYDDIARIVKSGGKTRRAAKMNSLKDNHPDIKEFIEAKSIQEKVIKNLIDIGYNPDFATENAQYQNANFSIRISDEFMKAVENNKDWQTIPVHNKELAKQMPKYKARELLRLIAKGTWECGDPGMQFDTTINKWHTCPNSARINASNPCSEYMFIDNSSCNLASHNLRGFVDENGQFNTSDFEKAIELFTIAQDILIDNSSFPRKEIAENSHRFRPLGQGHANLGGMLMSMGIPYDSDEGRAIAASITALQTAKVYKTSTKMAEKIGAFEEYEKNKKPMMKVLEKHRDELDKIDRNKLNGLENILDRAYSVMDNAIERGKKFGYRNAQATVLAPTGTIGFMMDCDTTGIEPDGALVKYKLLAGGGILKIINNSVPFALEKLGYDEKQKKSILKYIDENETIEGSELKPEHLSVFDCAFKPKKGKRTISPMGHVKMMAAVQPFLSGAISKTVNMPEEATVEEIEKTYVDAWKMGLKAIAIYRYGSKPRQPLSTSKKEKTLEQKLTPVRKKLPETRQSLTHKFDIAGHEGYFTVGLYDDGQPGEIFINMSKEGSTLGGLMDNWATTISLALQYGVPLKKLVEKYRGQKFEPRGLTGNKKDGIHTADSIPDYIGQWFKKRFLDGTEKEKEKSEIEPLKKIENNIKNKNEEKDLFEGMKPDGDFCINCGAQMFKLGHCEQRCKCGFVDYKGCGK